MKQKVILVDEDDSRAALLVQALIETNYDVVARFSAKDNLLKKVQEIDTDLIVIDMDSPDERILEQLKVIDEVCPKPVIFFADKGDSDMIKTAVKAGVSAFIVDGLTARRIKPVLDVALARFEENQALRQELINARSTISDRKIIERAKGIIMKKRDTDEDSAYKALRTMAMNQNAKLVDVARNVISVAELIT